MKGAAPVRGAAGPRRGSPGTAPCTLRCGQSWPGQTSKLFMLEGEAKRSGAFWARGGERGHRARGQPRESTCVLAFFLHGEEGEICPCLSALRADSYLPQTGSVVRAAPLPAPFQRPDLHPRLPSRGILLKIG